jgi:hypothetical protein
MAGGDGDGGVRRDTALSAQQGGAPGGPGHFKAQSAGPQPVFRSRREVITVDAIVRDKSGAIARGLTAADFEIREDGRPQEVLNFSFEEIRDNAPAKIETADLLAGVEARLQEQTRRPLLRRPRPLPPR